MEENKTLRRMVVLQKILFVPKVKCTSTSNPSHNMQVELNSPPAGLQKAFDVLFTHESLTFLSEMFTEFEQRIDQLHWNRLRRKIDIQSDSKIPKFLNTPQRRDNGWKIKELPKRLCCRYVDLGDVSPANTDHFVQALSTHVQGIQVDFDDGHCPTWRNQITGLYNVYRVVHGLMENVDCNINKLPVLMLRPRAWNMIEHNIMINGKKLPGPLVDFALLMFHNAQYLAESGNGPFFYLSKLEGAGEAKLWNSIFLWSQNRLGIPSGTIKACVLIENILSSFELDEILFELREHSLGLNCGIWDYAASIICKFGNDPRFVLPDRSKYVNMDRHFLKKYMELVVQICHNRGAPATGGMAALMLTTKNQDQIIEKVVNAKRKEIFAGCDGFLIYDVKFIPHINQLWQNYGDKFIKQINTSVISERDLLKIPSGVVTLEGLKYNIQVAVLFIYHWFHGKGHFIFKGCVEDSATAEISRSQIWQWIRHKAKIENSDSIVTKTFVEQLTRDFLKECYQLNQDLLTTSKDMFVDLITARNFVDFITTYLNDSFAFRNQQGY